VGTVIYEYRPTVSLPLLRGMMALSLGSEGNHPAGDVGPTWFIPAQVDPVSKVRGAMYQWVDMKTGETRGTFAVREPDPVIGER
jgi:hypothetical protein